MRFRSSLEKKASRNGATTGDFLFLSCNTIKLLIKINSVSLEQDRGLPPSSRARASQATAKEGLWLFERSEFHRPRR